MSIRGSDAGKKFEPACAAKASQMDAAFQRWFHSTNMGACSGAARGHILSPGRRTVAAALRVMGLEQAADFTNYHRVLNRNRWSGRWVARCLFR